MVAEAKDQTADTSQDAYDLVRARMESFAAESKVVPVNGNGYNLKVRKPYTIRKQRERWTEEEHQKFIEALKLYGRAWPQIEEHVGTKTAIQIRSHAQKFFAKVSREFDTDVGGSSTPIEIPPPRPKKKPLHPYPRKIVDSSKTEDIGSHQQETLKSPNVSVAERANFSPTSVLCNVAEMHKSRLSPTSCATDECSPDLLFTQNDRECMTSNTSDAEKEGSSSPVRSSASALNDKTIAGQTAGAGQDAYVLVRSQKEPLAAESKVLSLNRNGCTLRTRKPYTIRKQRERWTEEEHQKFVEALKLHGRAWRQIEEHVGTKTAIQIRSHAQKFFAKVSRDFDTDVGGSSTPVEIPPPRPKKKPLHPYPRKVFDSSKAEDFDAHQQETRSSPVVPDSGRENLVPASLLSNIVAEMHNGCLSASSCATDECSADLSFSENDREYMTSNISDAEKDGSRSPMGSSASAFRDKSITKFELFSREMEYLAGSPNAAEPFPSIKLFGKTVVERDTTKLYIEVEENSRSFPPNVRNNSESSHDNLVQNLASNYMHSQVEFGTVSQCATPYSLSHLLLHNAYHHMENIFTLPWSTWYQGVAYPYPSHCKMIAPQNAADFPHKGLKDEEIQQGSSKNQSNSGKGFVPYKRCSAERGDKLSMSFLQEQEGQRDRVCS